MRFLIKKGKDEEKDVNDDISHDDLDLRNRKECTGFYGVLFVIGFIGLPINQFLIGSMQSVIDYIRQYNMSYWFPISQLKYPQRLFLNNILACDSANSWYLSIIAKDGGKSIEPLSWR